MTVTPDSPTRTPVNYEAWARNAIGFIREHGLEQQFTNWCGGWPCPVGSVRNVVAYDAMLAALKVASGYLLNAKIDLETGAPKRTAIMTLDGGIKVVRSAIEAAETASPLSQIGDPQ